MILKVSVFVIVLFVGAALSASIDCNIEKCAKSTKIYEELGCKAVFGARSCCAKRFECPEFKKLDENKCSFEGREYAIGEVLPRNSTDKCSEMCLCTRQDNEPAKFSCSHSDCGVASFKVPGCLNVYGDLNECCSTSIVCDDEEKETLASCFVGQEYREGEKFIPASNPCYECLCHKGFDNSTITDNPYCRKLNCEIDLRYKSFVQRGCLPVFHSEKCCPVDWECPKHGKKIIKRAAVDEESHTVKQDVFIVTPSKNMEEFLDIVKLANSNDADESSLDTVTSSSTEAIIIPTLSTNPFEVPNEEVTVPVVVKIEQVTTAPTNDEKLKKMHDSISESSDEKVTTERIEGMKETTAKTVEITTDKLKESVKSSENSSSSDESSSSSEESKEKSSETKESSTESSTRLPENFESSKYLPENFESSLKLPDSYESSSKLPENSESSKNLPEHFESSLKLPESYESSPKLSESSESSSKSHENLESSTKSPESSTKTSVSSSESVEDSSSSTTEKALKISSSSSESVSNESGEAIFEKILETYKGNEDEEKKDGEKQTTTAIDDTTLVLTTEAPRIAARNLELPEELTTFSEKTTKETPVTEIVATSEVPSTESPSTFSPEVSTEVSADEKPITIISKSIDIESPASSTESITTEIPSTQKIPIQEVFSASSEVPSTTEESKPTTETVTTVHSDPGFEVSPTEFEKLLTTLKEFVAKVEAVTLTTETPKTTEEAKTSEELKITEEPISTETPKLDQIIEFVNYTVTSGSEKVEETKSISKRSVPDVDLIPRYYKQHYSSNKDKGCIFNGRSFKLGEPIKTDNDCLKCICEYAPIGHCMLKDKCNF